MAAASDGSAAALEALQIALAGRWQVEPRWVAPADLSQTKVGGAFVAAARGGEGAGAAGDEAWAAAVVMQGGSVVDAVVVHGRLDAAYLPGLLALREGRLLAETLRDLQEPPEVLLVNATGRDHPRRAGLALQLGATLGLPSIGVTDRPLLAQGTEPAMERSAVTELRLLDEVVAYRVRTRTNARPIVVHAGWRTDALQACSIILQLGGSSRTPPPLREARRLARSARAAAAQ